MSASQGPSRRQILAAVVGLCSLALVVFVTETGLGRDFIRTLTTSSISAAVTSSDPMVMFLVWSVIFLVALFVLDTGIGYFVE